MIYMITIILSSLVAVNFLLLKFSCNKTAKHNTEKAPFIIKTHSPTITNQQVPAQLAATGS